MSGDVTVWEDGRRPRGTEALTEVGVTAVRNLDPSESMQCSESVYTNILST